MSLLVKICGLRSPDAVAAAVDAGADALGFVFAESPRRVSPDQATQLCDGLPPGILRVAVMRHPGAAEWAAVQAGFRPDWLQTDAGDFAALAVDADVQPMPVFRDTPELDEDAAASQPRLLFEAADSGRGQKPDWQRAARLAQSTRLMLAGGLDPDNVAAAIAAVRPWGVDVSSGVESRRGVKDCARIAAFVAAARAMEQEYADGND
jgi:phosphoribosylanthranilate isomerase